MKNVVNALWKFSIGTVKIGWLMIVWILRLMFNIVGFCMKLIFVLLFGWEIAIAVFIIHSLRFNKKR